MRSWISLALFITTLGLGATAHAGKEPKEKFGEDPRMSRIAQRAVSRWAKQYKLSESEAKEQLQATYEGLAGIKTRGEKVKESWGFKYKVFAPPTGSKRVATVIRSGQPAPENLVEIGMAAAKLGIKPSEIAVINLRVENGMDREYIRDAASHSDPDVRAVGEFQHHHVRMIDHSIPTYSQVVEVLRVAANPKNKVVMLHCAAGVGRTGLMFAAMRIALDGWSVDKALREAEELGMTRELHKKFVIEFAEKWKAGQISLEDKS
jgi:hypothetical protein